MRWCGPERGHSSISVTAARSGERSNGLARPTAPAPVAGTHCLRPISGAPPATPSGADPGRHSRPSPLDRPSRGPPCCALRCDRPTHPRSILAAPRASPRLSPSARERLSPHDRPGPGRAADSTPVRVIVPSRFRDRSQAGDHEDPEGVRPSAIPPTLGASTATSAIFVECHGC